MSKLTAILLSLCLFAAGAAPAAAAPAPGGEKPKLVLVVVVDQFRYDYLTRFRASYTSGLARVIAGGAVFTNAHYEHFPTVTAVGHSVVLSGAMPAVSGIVGNEWYDRELARQVTSVYDPKTQLLGGEPNRAGASPRRLLVSTLGDELKLGGGGDSKVYSVSSKDRAAIMMVGHMADGAFWFDPATGNFASSTFYFPDMPAWAKAFNQSRAADQWLGKEWWPMADSGPRPAKPFAKLPATPGKAYYDGLERTPWSNDLLVMFAERILAEEKLGQRSGTDLLAVSFSCNDRIGHAVGPHSPEVADLSVQTDRTLGRLLDFVDRSVGLKRTLVLVTADHGVAPLPEQMQASKMPGGRISEKAVHETVERALVAAYGEGNWVVGYSGPAPYLNYDLIRRKNLKLAEVQETAAAAVRRMDHIARVYTGEQMRNGHLSMDMVGQRIANGAHFQRGTDLVVVAEPNWLFEDRGTSHGTPYNYDTHVPVVLMGAGIRPGVYHQRIVVNDVAPTLATLLGIEVPGGASGRALAEILTGGLPASGN